MIIKGAKIGQSNLNGAKERVGSLRVASANYHKN